MCVFLLPIGDQFLERFYDLGHGRAFLMILRPHALYQVNDLRAPLFSQTS